MIVCGRPGHLQSNADNSHLPTDDSWRLQRSRSSADRACLLRWNDSGRHHARPTTKRVGTCDLVHCYLCSVVCVCLRVATFSLSQSGTVGPADGHPGVIPPENFRNSVCDLVYFYEIWWQLFVGRRTRYICNFAIKTEPICQLQCPHDCTAVLPLLSNEHALKSGTFGVPGWSCWDVEPHGTNLGHPGKSGTGGNPSVSVCPSITSQYRWTSLGGCRLRG